MYCIECGNTKKFNGNWSNTIYYFGTVIVDEDGDCICIERDFETTDEGMQNFEAESCAICGSSEIVGEKPDLIEIVRIVSKGDNDGL
jgi:hypothetical protein